MGVGKGDEGFGAEEVKSARAAAGLTQAAAAALVYTSISNWQNWEQGRYLMIPAIYELFLLKTGLFTLNGAKRHLEHAVLRLRLRSGHAIDFSVKKEVAHEIVAHVSRL